MKLRMMIWVLVTALMGASEAMAKSTPKPMAVGAAGPASTVSTPSSRWFNRQVSHWDEVDDSFIDYIVDVKPQHAQAGFFGPEYYSAVGYMKELSAKTLWAGIGGGRIDQDWWRGAIQRAHANGIKVIGQFSLAMVYGDAVKDRGWFGYFDKDWDEALLGPKPRRADGSELKAIDLMQHLGPERTADSLSKAHDYAVEGGFEYNGCPSNPYWRETLKRFVKAGIDLGLDGFTVVFPHREDCTCEFCQAGFKKFLSSRYTPAQIKANFGIDDLANYHFDHIYGWYEPEDASLLRLEQLKFSELTIWDCRREVFADYGRRLKPDLILGEWNHIYRSSMAGPGQIPGTFAQLNADERCVLPTELWAVDEDFVWYSVGNWSLYYKPEAGEYSQFSLEHKYLREAGRGLPQAVKRDDGQNLRVYISEAVAHGGFSYARGPNYKDPATHEVVKTYFDFLRRNESLYRPIQSYANIALVFPRSAVHRGDKSYLLDFKNIGRILTRRHISFDVIIDEMMTPQRMKQYSVVLQPQSDKLTPADDPALMALQRESVVDAPEEVVSVVWRQPQHVLLHLVNYKRDTSKVLPPAQGAAAERPLPQQDIKVHLRLPKGSRAQAVELLSPEGLPQQVAFKQTGDMLNLTVDQMLVYTVVNVTLK